MDAWAKLEDQFDRIIDLFDKPKEMMNLKIDKITESPTGET